ncbi:MAG: class I SAM-dependent methyltransferase [Desulfobacteraceae bacterium]|jgi:tRNA (cmo5U34)-methyltransferase
MAEFEKTRWADSEFSKLYRDGADIYIPFRRRFVEVTKSLYSFFFKDRSELRVLDLGCGDGFFAEEFLKEFTPAGFTLSDGSGDMLTAARKRLKEQANVEYIQASFQNIIESDILSGDFDFIYSSFAIHHLPLSDKKRLYSKIYKILNPRGCFVHNDVIEPFSDRVENWYLMLWREWIDQFPDKNASYGMEVIPEKYKESPDDFPDSLETHLDILKKTGFKDVDCFFKYGIFALFGGFKLNSD